MSWRQFREDFPARVLLEVIVGTAMAFFIMYLWYIFQPITISLMNELQTLAQDMGHFNSFISSGFTILSYIVYWWGPALVISIVVLWLFLITQREDWRGHYEY